jgi:rubrerythrin
MHFHITELHNFGGFFGGDTVTLSGAPWGAAEAEEQTLTIDQAALTNVADRHTLSVGMVLELAFAGERVETATLLGARDPDQLRAALGPPSLPETLDAPLVLSFACAACGLWVAVDPAMPPGCPLCGASAGNTV